jgi:hypothetical protein
LEAGEATIARVTIARINDRKSDNRERQSQEQRRQATVAPIAMSAIMAIARAIKKQLVNKPLEWQGVRRSNGGD